MAEAPAKVDAGAQGSHASSEEEVVDARTSIASTLPDPVLECLLLLADVETFASLSVVNRHYRRVSNTKSLYFHHLAHHAFFDPFKNDDYEPQQLNNQSLEYLKRQCARLAKHERFSVYRPQIYSLELLSPELPLNIHSADGACDLRSYLSADATKIVIVGGTNGTHLYVFDLSAAEPFLKPALDIRVRSSLVEISNDGTTLATLESGNVISVYSLEEAQCLHLKRLEASQPVASIALTPDGMVLAAAGESGMALFSIKDNQASVPRHVPNSTAVSHLCFVNGGTMLCGLQASHDGSKELFSRAADMPAKVDQYSLNGLARAWMKQPLHQLDPVTTYHRSERLAETRPQQDSSIFNCEAYLRRHWLDDAIFQAIIADSTGRLPSGDSHAPMPLSMTASRDLVATSAGRRCLSVYPSHEFGGGLIDSYRTYQDPIPSFAERLKKFNIQPTGDGTIIQFKWLVDSTHKHSCRQRLVVLSTPEPTASNEDTQDRLRLTVLDFDYHVECMNRNLVIDIAAIPLQTIGNTDVTGENLNASGYQEDEQSTVAHQDDRSSVSSLTYNSFHNSSTASSNCRGVSPDEQKKTRSFLPSEVPSHDSGIPSVATQRARANSAPLGAILVADGDNEATFNKHAGDVSSPSSNVDAQTPRDDLPRHLKSLRRTSQSANGLPLVTTSTPNLLMQSQVVPDAVPRPRKQDRVRSTYDAARSSVILSGKNLRRVFSGPLESTHSNEAQHDKPASPTMTARNLRQRPKSMAVPTLPSEEQAPRRRSILPRPLSWSSNTILSSAAVPTDTGSRPSGRRSVSQPLDRPNTPPSQITIPSPYEAESPTLPSPAQVLSLHRRQASGSISSVHIRSRSLSGSNDPFAIAGHAGGSDGTTAPRAALGAYRRNTGTIAVSPWASTTMLSRGEDWSGGNRRFSMPLNAVDGNGKITMNGRTVSAPMLGKSIPEPTSYTNGRASGSGVINSRLRGASMTSSGQGPPARLQENSLPSTPNMQGSPNASNELDPQTSNDGKPLPAVPAQELRASKTPRTRKGGRLSTIQSVASLMGAARSSSSGEAQTSRKVRPQTMPVTSTQQATAGAVEDQQRSVLNDVTNSRVALDTPAQGGKRSLWGKFMRKVMDNLQRV